MPSLIIFGVGSVAKLAYYYAHYELGFNVVAFAVDPSSRVDAELFGLPILDAETLAETYSKESVSIFVAVGYKSMFKRAEAWCRFNEAGWKTPTLVSPRAYVAQSATLGPNCFVMPGAVVEPGSTIGANNLIWSNSTICHHSIIGSHNFFASNTTVGGEVTIGDRCFFGFSSTIIQQRIVGSDVVIAAASLLMNDANAFGRYVGVPALRTDEINPSTGACIS